MALQAQVQTLAVVFSVLVLSVLTEQVASECSFANPCLSGADPCCSSTGFCGHSDSHCKYCNVNASLAQDGKCPDSTSDNHIDLDSGSCFNDTERCPVGSCCSSFHTCGTLTEHCGYGCLGGDCFLHLSVGVQIVAGLAILLAVPTFVGCVNLYHYATKSTETPELGFRNPEPRPVTGYAYNKLEAATHHFDTIIGEGASGRIYKGKLEDGSDIAVKWLSKIPGGYEAPGQESFNLLSHLKAVILQWSLGFRSLFWRQENELKDDILIAEVQNGRKRTHKNLLALKGHCLHENVTTGDTQRFLVYEYFHKGSLAEWLFVRWRCHALDRSEQFLRWENRKKIALGVASALEYLHSGMQGYTTSLHLDIKPETILLDDDFVPKVADFAFSRFLLGNHRRNPPVRTGKGSGLETLVYMAPEVQQSQTTSTCMSDVFSFGIVILELVSGRSVYNDSRSVSYLPLLVMEEATKWAGGELNLVDPKLRLDDHAESEAKRFLRVALWCLRREPKKRPAMHEVKRLLSLKSKCTDEFPVDTQLPEELMADLQGIVSTICNLKNESNSSARSWRTDLEAPLLP